MFLGLDLGTSAVKAVLVNADNRIIDSKSCPFQSAVRIRDGRSRTRSPGGRQQISLSANLATAIQTKWLLLPASGCRVRCMA